MNIDFKAIKIDGIRPQYSDDAITVTVSAWDLKEARISAYLQEANIFVAQFNDTDELTAMSVNNLDILEDASIFDTLTIKINYSGITITKVQKYTVETFVEEIKALKPEDFADEETEMTRPSDYEDDYEPVGTGVYAHWAKSEAAQAISDKGSHILMSGGRLSLKNIRKLSEYGIKVTDGEMDSFGPLSMILSWTGSGGKRYGFVCF